MIKPLRSLLAAVLLVSLAACGAGAPTGPGALDGPIQGAWLNMPAADTEAQENVLYVFTNGFFVTNTKTDRYAVTERTGSYEIGGGQIYFAYDDGGEAFLDLACNNDLLLLGDMLYRRSHITELTADSESIQ